MRKKSHISLAGQIMDSMNLENVFDYKLPFYIGSIWPDCRPSFVTTPHKFDITFHDIEKKLSKFIANYNPEEGMEYASLRTAWSHHSLYCRLLYFSS